MYMMKISFSLFIAVLMAGQVSGQLSGKLNYLELSSDLIEDRKIALWTPSMSEGPYKLIIMHDGQMLFQGDSTWNGQEWGVDESLDSLYQAHLIGDVMVVAIWNIYAHRHRNYFPQKPFEDFESSLRDSLLELKRPGQEMPLFSGSPNADNYLAFIFEELLPVVKEQYAIQEDEIYMMGSSMGGLISMYAAVEYAKELNGVACFSTHWPGVFQNSNNPIPDAFISYLDAHRSRLKKSRWYFDRGDATLDAMYPAHQDRVDSLFQDLKLGDQQFQSLVFPGDAHDEMAWRRRFPAAVLYLLQAE